MPSGDHEGWNTDSSSPPATRTGTPGAPAAVEIGHVELGAVPRHVGMAPLQPRQAPAVGAERRVRVEVGALGQHDTRRGLRAVERDGDDCGRGLGVAPGVVLADADQARAERVDHALRVEVALGRERPLRPAGGDVVEALVGEIRGVDRAPVHDVGRAAVFVDARPDVEAGRRDVHRRGAGRGPHQHVASALRGPAFEPVDVVAVEGDLSEAQRAGGGPRGREGRGPRAVGSLGRRGGASRGHAVAARRGQQARCQHRQQGARGRRHRPHRSRPGLGSILRPAGRGLPAGASEDAWRQSAWWCPSTRASPPWRSCTARSRRS